MKNKKLISIILTILTIIALTACGNNEKATALSDEKTPTTANADETSETEVTDMIGRKVTVNPGSYKKVVCIGAGALRMYSYIGDVSLLSGVEDIDNTSLSERPQMFDGVARPYVIANEEVFSQLPSCGVGGPNAQAAEAEKILSCKPDIVISEYEDADKEDALQEQLNVPVITLKTGPMGVFDDAFFESMNLLGEIFEKEDKAESLVNYITKEKEDITKRTSDIKEEEKPSVYICGLGNWGTTNHLMTAQNYVSFKVANVKNVVTGLEADGVQEIESEKFVSLGADTDIMFIDAAAVKNIKPLYEEDPSMFDTMKAWKEGNVYLEMAFNAYYTNYETALINTWYIAKTVYPDKFEDIDITQKTNEVTKAFLGKEMAKEIFSKPASFGGYQKIDTNSFFK
ncbi:iron complex transport system substrate-binding protein [Acetitomaculum ruminis DSM 5522]|uniref:Iron complex transport system substrate-binding protein n=1 Tax=Acetitomaculum ruminis DSM 5522 TaxID=1120918 RepID=A0A1I0ZSX4_9FIRM|nr:ABC transporter substrate-binding protein [Acetitomaculum ruminis]SFB28647.1 iron complex transport system substrate-binding protein [Acetitomaculum ruminis DSM 5522]